MLRNRRAGVALVAAVLALSIASSASAAGWSPPAPLPGASSGELSGGLSLAFDQDGHGLATWGYGFHTAATGVETRTPAGDWQRQADELPGLSGVPAQYGKERVMSLTQLELPLPGVSGIFVRFGRLAGFYDHAVRIGDGPASDLAIASDARGNAVAVAGSGRSGATVIQAAARPAGGRFGTLHRISHTWSRFPAVAVDEHGTAIVAWWRKVGSSRRIVEARLYRPGAGWGPIERVADLPPTTPGLSVAAAHGLFVVGWASHDISSGGEDMGINIGAAVREAGGGWRARTLQRTSRGAVQADPNLPGSSTAIRVFADAQGRGSIVFAGQDAGVPRVEALRVSPAGFGETVTVAGTPGEQEALADAALAPDGRLAVALIAEALPDGPPRLVVATTPPGPLAPSADVVSAPDQQARAARVAFDPASGALVALWAHRVLDGGDGALFTSELAR